MKTKKQFENDWRKHYIYSMMKDGINILYNSEIATSEEIGLGVARVKVNSHHDPNRLLQEVHQLFDRTYKAGYFRILFDMENVIFPNGSFIGMLIGRTIEARRHGGDVKIVHLSETARNHFAMFSALTYLTIGQDEMARDDSMAFSPLTAEDFGELEEGKVHKLQIDATVESLAMMTHFVEGLGREAGMEQIEISKLKIAVYEAGMNVIEHGYRFAMGKSMGVEVVNSKQKFTVTITDQGKAFDVYGIKSYDVKDKFRNRRNGGYGLYIIQRSVDEIKYESDSVKGNRLTLIKHVS